MTVLSYTMHDAQVKQTPIKYQIWTYGHFLIPSIHQTLLYYTGVGILNTGKQPVSFFSPITYGRIICTVVFTLLHYSHVGEMFQKHVLLPS